MHIVVIGGGALGLSSALHLVERGVTVTVIEANALASGSTGGLSAGNAPHQRLRDRVAAYRALIEQDLSDIDFSLLYIAGVRLALQL